MNVKKVGNVILAVKDLNKSVEFYNKILGMPIKRQRENWVDLGQSGALLSLHPASTSSPHSGTSVDNGILIGLLVGDVASAVDDIAKHRALIGAQVSRLNHIYQGNASYGDNMAQAEARIRDVDFAKETAELAAAQVGTQAAAAMLQQANLTTQIVMQLLQ